MYLHDTSHPFPLVSFEPTRFETCGSLYHSPPGIHFSPAAVALETANAFKTYKKETGDLCPKDTHATNAGSSKFLYHLSIHRCHTSKIQTLMTFPERFEMRNMIFDTTC